MDVIRLTVVYRGGDLRVKFLVRDLIDLELVVELEERDVKSNAFIAAFLMSLSLTCHVVFAAPEANLGEACGQPSSVNESVGTESEATGTAAGASEVSDNEDVMAPSYSPAELSLYDDTRERRSKNASYGFNSRSRSILETSVIQSLRRLMRSYLKTSCNGKLLLCEVRFRIGNDGQVEDLEITQNSLSEDFDSHVKDAMKKVRIFDSNSFRDKVYRIKLTSMELMFRGELMRIDSGRKTYWSIPILRPDVF